MTVSEDVRSVQRSVCRGAVSRSIIFLSGTVYALGCSVRTIEEATPDIARNQCDVNKDCAGGRCSHGMCVATKAGLSTLLFEVTPPATAGAEYASVRYLKTVSDLDGQDARRALNLEFDVVAAVTGAVNAQPASAQTGCEFRFESGETAASKVQLDSGEGIPGSLTFTSSEQLPGLPTVPYSVETHADGPDKATHGYDLRMPPGKYDVYVVPWRPAAKACAVAPQILRGQSIAAGNVTLSLQLPPPQLLRIEILGPSNESQGNPLQGWRVDMVDPNSALVLSTMSVLEDATTVVDGRLAYETELYYSPVWDVDQKDFVGVGHELVRLRPPENSVGPSLFAERASLELFQAGEAMIEMDGLSEPVHVEGQLELASEDGPVAAHLVFAAEQLLATNAGYLTSFIVELDVGDNGRLVVDLLPGRYSVRAVPECPTRCLLPNPTCDCPVPTEVEWEIAAEPTFQAGRTLKLSPGAVIRADVIQPVGARPLVGASARATSVPITADALDELLRGTTAAPGVFTTDTDSAGTLQLTVPSGQFVFTVMPPDGSDYPWLVRPKLTTPYSRNTKPAPVDLDELPQPLPVVYTGAVRVPSQSTSDLDGLVEVPGALIRAYAFEGPNGLVDSGSDSEFVVQVAETRAAEDGTFKLLIPSALQ